MKTKDGRKKVSGFGCQVSGKKSEVRSPKSEVGMTEPGVRSHIPGICTRRSFWILSPDSCLLTPVLKYEGDSGNVDENKG
jgi:hypothetical protein